MTNMCIPAVAITCAAGVTRYYYITGGGNLASETSVQIPFTACTLKKLRINIISNGLAVGEQAVISIRKNSASTPLALTIFNGESGLKTVEADVDVADSDMLNYRVTNTGTGSITVTASFDFL